MNLPRQVVMNFGEIFQKQTCPAGPFLENGGRGKD
jgi:hypothetical protein